MFAVPPMAPPAIVVQDPSVEAKTDGPGPSLLSLVAFKKGAFLLVDATHSPSWMKALDDPDLAEVSVDLVIRVCKLGDKAITPLGIVEVGAYLLNRKGEILGRWDGSPPPDLREAFSRVGWLSTSEELDRFIQAHPKRVDARWARFGLLEGLLRRHQGARIVSETARVLDDLLRQPDWAASPNIFGPAVEPAAGISVDNPLSTLARERIEIVREILRHSPGHSPAWRLMVLLTAWHPEKSSLASFLESLEVPVWEENPAAWPHSEALDACEFQLRAAKDWPAMRRFAQSRLEILSRHEAGFHPQAGEEWSGRLTVTKQGVKRTSRKELGQAGLGRWLALLFEAEVHQGRIGAASDVAQRLVSSGSAENRLHCLVMARHLKLESIIRILDSK